MACERVSDMEPDLRSFLKSYEEFNPRDVIHIRKPVNCRFEATAVVMGFEQQRKFPALVFHEPVLADGNKSQFPLVLNPMATRKKLAHAIGSTFDEVGFEWVRRARTETRKPVVVDRSQAPCKQVVLSNEQVNLTRYPAMVHHEEDPGAYISGGMLTCYDPDAKIDNMAMQRGFIVNKTEVRIHIRPHTHNYLNLVKWENRGMDMPAVFWIGHHPAVMMGCQSSPPYPGSHYEAAGAVLGQPLRLTPSETLGDDFLVPAEAEFVVEGFIRRNVRREEAPFGDYTKYYDEPANSPVLEVTCVTHRSDAMWLSHMVGHDEVFGCTFKEVDLTWAVKKVVPQVRNVYMIPWGVQHIAFIQIKQTAPGQAKASLAAALGSSIWCKVAIVVDEDIDIYDEKEVFWALATRFQPAEDLFIIPSVVGAGLDPSTERVGNKDFPVGSRVGLDATKPFGKPFARKLDIPQTIKDKIKLEDLLPAEVIDKVPDMMER